MSKAAYCSNFHEKHRNCLWCGFDPGISRAASKPATTRPLWPAVLYSI